LFLTSLFLTVSTSAEQKVTYQDQILPLIEANCSKCHNSDKKKADLDLTSYQGALKGSGSGAVLVSGNPDGSKLWKAVTHAEEPTMPPNRAKLGDKELDLIKKWITGGLLENATGKAVAAAKPAVDLTLQADAVGKPDGPPPMPVKQLPLKPVISTSHLNAITGLAASPWAPLVAVAGQRQVLLYNSDNLHLLGILPFTEGEPMDLKFSRNGKLLLGAGGRGANSGRVMVWDVQTGEKVMVLGNDYDTVLSADMRPDQSQVAMGGPGRLVKVFATKTSELQHKIKKHTDWVTAVAFSPNGQMLASADRNGGVSVWDPDNAQELFTLAGHKSAVTALNWRGDSKLLASSSEDGTIKLWEMKEGKQAKTWNAHPSGTRWVSYSHDGRLVSCGRDNAITIWNASGARERNLEGSCDLPLCATFSYDNKRIFASDFSGHIGVWTVADGKRLGELNANPGAQTSQFASAKTIK
jgi:WD40 repeat protein